MSFNGTFPARGITTTLANMSLQNQQPREKALQPRSGYGTLGIKTRAQVNHIAINVSKVPELSQYSLTVHCKDEPDSIVKPRVRQRVIQLLLNAPGFDLAASDYTARLVSARKLTQTADVIRACEVDYYEEEESGPRSGTDRSLYLVKLRFQKAYSMQTLHATSRYNTPGSADEEDLVTALNLLINREPAQNLNFKTSGRRAKVFDIGPGAVRDDLGKGAEVFGGYFRAVTLTVSGLTLNINPAVAAMIKAGPFLTILLELARRPATVANELGFLGSTLKGSRVEHQYTGRPVRRTVYRFAQMPDRQRGTPPYANAVSFVRDFHPKTQATEQKKVTVQQHFLDAYNINVPSSMLVVDLGGPRRPCFVPANLLTILPGNLYHGLLPYPEQHTRMIRFACRAPDINRKDILGKGLFAFKLSQNGSFLNRLGINASNRMKVVDARVLPPAVIAYGVNLDKSVGDGSWNMMNRKFRKGPDVRMMFSWVEILPPNMRPASNLQGFVANIRSLMNNYVGASVNMVSIPGFQHSKKVQDIYQADSRFLSAIWKTMMDHKICLVFVILPEASQELYAAVKLSADTLYGIHTICTVRKDNGTLRTSPGEVTNLLLKVNMKLGGVNLVIQPPKGHVLSNILSKRIMFVGADVTHPSPRSLSNAPSVASVVATNGPDLFQYSGRLALQHHEDKSKQSVEFIKDFARMLLELVTVYRTRNGGQLPEVLFFYRDGVADNMFQQSVNKELAPAMRKLKEIYDKVELPKVVYMIVQKRHHTRFYSDNAPGFDKKGSPLPGLIIDKDVTHAWLGDFFLFSHRNLQGTSRPAHYSVVYNDTSLSVDEIQVLTFNSCFLMGRATKSISIHPAARYADMLCDRARAYLREVYAPSNGDQLESYSPSKHWSGHIHHNLLNSMFWV